ncbi:MAG: hypothetical protein ACYDC0_16285 [Acidimicrobiales bacterium]
MKHNDGAHSDLVVGIIGIATAVGFLVLGALELQEAGVRTREALKAAFERAVKEAVDHVL